MIPAHNGYTTLEYNGVQLRNCQTLKFQETPEEDGMGTVILITGRIRVVGYWTSQKGFGTWGTYPQFADAASSADMQQSAPTVHHALHSELMQARRHLRYIFNDIPGRQTGVGAVNNSFATVDIYPADHKFDSDGEMTENDDAAGGPKPLDLLVTQIAGSTTWRVEFEVQYAFRPRCRVDDNDDPVVLNSEDPIEAQYAAEELTNIDYHNVQQKYGVLSNLWTCVDSIDPRGFTTRQISGVVRLANPNWNPHDYRVLTLPPLHPGMKREGWSFTSTENGLVLSYQFTDREVYMSAPGNATHVSLDYTDQVVMGTAGQMNFVCRCEVAGHRWTPKAEMLEYASAMVDAKIMLSSMLDPLNPVSAKYGVMVMSIEMYDHQGTDGNNSVMLTMSGFRTLMVAPPHLQFMQMHTHMGANTCRRIGPIPGTALAFYNNQRSQGNRHVFDVNGNIVGYETPSVEGYIPALSALAAALQSRCTESYGHWKAMKRQMDSTAMADRAARVADMEPQDDEYDPSSLYSAQTLANIVENDLDIIAEDLTYSTAHRNQMYTRYDMSSTYSSDSMTYKMPVAGTTASLEYPNNVGPTFIARLAATQTVRHVTISAERFGSPVVFPSVEQSITESTVSDTADATAELQSVHEEHMVPVPGAGGVGYLYRAVLHAIYNYLTPPTYRRSGIPGYDAAVDTAYGGSIPGENGVQYRTPISQIFGGGWSIKE